MRRLFLASLAIAIAAPLLATEPNPSAEQRRLVEKLFVAMNFDVTLHNTMDAMFAQMEKQLLDSAAQKGSDADAIAEAHEVFASFRNRAAKLNFGNAMREDFIQIYSKFFTEQELRDVVAFYESPAGRKAIEVLPRIMTEGMQAAERHISPQIEQAIKEAMEEQERKRPWRRTMSDIRTVATALEAFAIDHDDKYPSGDYAALQTSLVPNYLKTLPARDMWDHEYGYAVSADGKHYRIVSAGADSIFEWDSRQVGAGQTDEQPAIRYRDRLEDDLIYQDGGFVQLPVQAKPRQK